ncbi:CLUMA_CG018833, isoform A [Clunio marinus]|uniref:CLUMA_CG018833, isoform A n=1 Tax=Clunio marinus TaxID=568069 RepID=A0A1J1J021_9DIPT|nr:CLUMA_CG018833, isoform A [Clunio marinus]
MRLEIVLFFVVYTSAIKLDGLLEISSLEEEIFKNVSSKLADIMKNDEAYKKGFIELTVSETNETIESGKGLQELIRQLNLQDILIVFRSRKSSHNEQEYFRLPDFGLILLDSKCESTTNHLLTMPINFPDKFVNLFVICNSLVSKTSARRNMNFIKDDLMDLKYRKFISILIFNSSEYEISSGLTEDKIIKVVQYDMQPFTKIVNRKITGPEGKFLDTFCTKYNLTYELINSNNITNQVNFAEIQNSIFNEIADLNLNNGFSISHPRFVKINIGILDGSCMLAPKNIYISSYENSSFPFDTMTIVLMIVSIISTILLWKMLSSYAKTQFKISFIMINIFKCTIGQEVSGEKIMSRKEKIVIYSYIFASMIFVSLYQSILIALMLSEPSLRSVESLKELNDSNTNIYEYMHFDSDYTPSFREEKILTKLGVRGKYALELSVPMNFDQNLAYFVTCSYADEFLKSERNYDGNRRLLDKIPEQLSFFPQQYILSSAFLLRKEIEFVASVLRESGIRNYWISKAVDDPLDQSKKKVVHVEEKSYVDFKNMIMPFVVLSSGAVLALFAFIFEIIISFMNERKMRKVVKVKQNPRRHSPKQFLK